MKTYIIEVCEPKDKWHIYSTSNSFEHIEKQYWNLRRLNPQNSYRLLQVLDSTSAVY